MLLRIETCSRAPRVEIRPHLTEQAFAIAKAVQSFRVRVGALAQTGGGGVAEIANRSMPKLPYRWPARWSQAGVHATSKTRPRASSRTSPWMTDRESDDRIMDSLAPISSARWISERECLFRVLRFPGASVRTHGTFGHFSRMPCPHGQPTRSIHRLSSGRLPENWRHTRGPIQLELQFRFPVFKMPGQGKPSSGCGSGQDGVRPRGERNRLYLEIPTGCPDCSKQLHPRKLRAGWAHRTNRLGWAANLSC